MDVKQQTFMAMYEIYCYHYVYMYIINGKLQYNTSSKYFNVQLNTTILAKYG